MMTLWCRLREMTAKRFCVLGLLDWGWWWRWAYSYTSNLFVPGLLGRSVWFQSGSVTYWIWLYSTLKLAQHSFYILHLMLTEEQYEIQHGFRHYHPCCSIITLTEYLKHQNKLRTNNCHQICRWYSHTSEHNRRTDFNSSRMNNKVKSVKSKFMIFWGQPHNGDILKFKRI